MPAVHAGVAYYYRFLPFSALAAPRYCARTNAAPTCLPSTIADAACRLSCTRTTTY